MKYNSMYHALIKTYQTELDAIAAKKTKVWWERYMKGVIPFRGVGIPKNRELLIRWRRAHGIEQWPVAQQLDLALAFFQESMAEDKLAGILFLQNFLYDALSWETLLPRYDKLLELRDDGPGTL